MMLKKIPNGTKLIKFINYTKKNCVIHYNKKPFLFVEAGHYKICDCKTFLIEFQIDEFPEMNLYSSHKIGIEIK